MKSISQHLSEIENEVIREKALAYYELKRSRLPADTREARTAYLSTAINSAFTWSNTNDGHDYWHSIETLHRQKEIAEAIRDSGKYDKPERLDLMGISELSRLAHQLKVSLSPAFEDGNDDIDEDEIEDEREEVEDEEVHWD